MVFLNYNPQTSPGSTPLNWTATPRIIWEFLRQNSGSCSLKTYLYTWTACLKLGGWTEVPPLPFPVLHAHPNFGTQLWGTYLVLALSCQIQSICIIFPSTPKHVVLPHCPLCLPLHQLKPRRRAWVRKTGLPNVIYHGYCLCFHRLGTSVQFLSCRHWPCMHLYPWPNIAVEANSWVQ